LKVTYLKGFTIKSSSTPSIAWASCAQALSRCRISPSTLHLRSLAAGVPPAHWSQAQEPLRLLPSAPGGKKDLVFEVLHACQRAIELHDQDKLALANDSFKQAALLSRVSARLLCMLGNEDEVVHTPEHSLELTVAMARVMCDHCRQARGQVLMLETTCGKCGVARYCSKEHQNFAWNAQQGEQKANGVTQFLAHRFLCRALKTFKSVTKGRHQSEECRIELLGLLRTMVHWKSPEFWGTAGKLAERQLVAGATVQLAGARSSRHWSLMGGRASLFVTREPLLSSSTCPTR